MKGKPPKVHKEPIDPERVRRIPAEGFSWLDRRFVREGFIERLPCEAILLYWFLVSVSDSRGLSFYSEATISRILKLNAEEISQARARLISADLILYRYPLYQVLALPAKRRTAPARRSPSPTPRPGDRGGLASLREILQLARENAGEEESDDGQEDSTQTLRRDPRR